MRIVVDTNVIISGVFFVETHEQRLCMDGANIKDGGNGLEKIDIINI